MSNQRAYNRRKRSTVIISIPVVYLEICDRHYETAAVLKQIDFWSGQCGDDDGWFYRTHAKWAEDLHIPERTFRRIVRKLEGKGFIQTKVEKVGKTPVMHYRPIDDAIESAMGMNDDSSAPKPPESDPDKMADSDQLAQDKMADPLEVDKMADPSIYKDYKKTSSSSDEEEAATGTKITAPPIDALAVMFTPKPWMKGGRLDEGFKQFIAAQMPDDGYFKGPKAVKAIRHIRKCEAAGDLELLEAQWEAYQESIKPVEKSDLSAEKEKDAEWLSHVAKQKQIQADPSKRMSAMEQLRALKARYGIGEGCSA